MKTETIEGNKLIAEFRKKTFEGDNRFVFDKDGYAIENYANMQYHSSWEWLMPVVEKIEQTHWVTITTTPRNNIGTATSIVSTNRPFKTYARQRTQSKIESVYLAVIEFIKWHNSVNQ